MQKYPTKTKKRNALKRLRSIGMGLWASGAITMKDAEAIRKIVDMRKKQL